MQESNGENASVTNNLAGTTRGTAAAAAERKQEYKIKRSDCHRLWLLLPLQNKAPPLLHRIQIAKVEKEGTTNED
jgi:hypothetical protein